MEWREFPGSPVVKTPGLLLQRAQIQSLLGELKIPHAAWHDRKKEEEKKRKINNQDFSGVSVVKNLPANAGDTGSIPDPGRFHMPWGS